MNIFVLDRCPREAAKMHCNKHVIKMILESCQLLYCVIYILDESILDHVEEINGLPAYKMTHVNHPCAIWARQSKANYKWLLDLAKALMEEKRYRYPENQPHLCEKHILGLEYALDALPWDNMDLTPWAKAHPYKSMENVVDSYRHYYIMDKQRMLQYTLREKPSWLM